MQGMVWNRVQVRFKSDGNFFSLLPRHENLTTGKLYINIQFCLQVWVTPFASVNGTSKKHIVVENASLIPDQHS